MYTLNEVPDAFDIRFR